MKKGKKRKATADQVLHVTRLILDNNPPTHPPYTQFRAIGDSDSRYGRGIGISRASGSLCADSLPRITGIEDKRRVNRSRAFGNGQAG